MKLQTTNYKLQTVRGFTLIETLVAVTILVGAVTATLAISVQGMLLSNASRERLVAAYLAEEPIEYIRSERDSNVMQGMPGWLDGLAPCMAPQTCQIDMSTTPPTVTPCSGACPALRFDELTGLYGYVRGTDSLYARSVSIVTPVAGNADEAEITVTMNWRGRSTPKSFVVTDTIFRW